MPDQTQLREMLSALTEEVAESVLYFRELGAQGLEASVDFAPGVEARDGIRPNRAAASTTAAAAVAPPLSTALERNARAEAGVKPPPRITLPPPPRRVGGEATNIQYQTAMPTKPIRKPSPHPPAPRETLFGEITPMDELSLGQPGETFDDIREDIGECVRCPLHAGRTKIVHTEGDRQSRLMFVGEAPGADEDASGRPFVGRAGQLLNKIIEAIGLKREDVLIGNVNRCRPPGNRTPTSEEAATCKPFLLREINIARPEVIIVLGNTAMKNLLDTKEGITKLRGNFQDYKGIKVMPTFHPAYLLRDPSKKREVWDDMKKVRDYLNENRKP